MGQIKVILPAMGEGIFEATITQWLVDVGSEINEDDSLVEIATDKVDSEVPSPVKGVLHSILVQAGETAKIGQEIAIVEVKGKTEESQTSTLEKAPLAEEKPVLIEQKLIPIPDLDSSTKPAIPYKLNSGVFLSPLVRSIAHTEGISLAELEAIQGTGVGNRITKEDILKYMSERTSGTKTVEISVSAAKIATTSTGGFEVIEMDRMRKLIADNMVRSKQVSPHVTSFHEVDVTAIVTWREKHKEEFQKRFGQKLTFTPIFIDAVVRAIKMYPMINISVDGSKILLKKQVNIGMATALPDGNLIVPVIHSADELSISGLASRVNDLAQRARNRKLLPTEIQGGTFTITNVGTFGNLSGTPIINQPEVAILAIGAIKKRPAVIETPQGDLIGIRHQMILALSYDHRVVDGSLGGMFIKQVADNMEAFDGTHWL
ncbi:MAG: 2-oxoglutarate dehydrogenase [Bacteroidetes bacterium HGW-Bacteroidetes-4]|jgi:2-oxoglutarate dehydrogenase E2 component (dihydrolipoamide succinyltransferase)|nr:MAG: 2-oxoglutarate dehydrogenase [Bacteroidetes bacterium HGW-Bacteroidetes-4]